MGRRDRIVIGCLLACLVPSGRAAGPDAALDLVDAAIRARGGADRLARTRFLTRTARGVSVVFGREIPFSTQLTLAFPDRLRDRIEIRDGQERTLLLRVVSGEQGWQSALGATGEISRDELADLREEIYTLWLATLVPLRDPAFDRTRLADVVVNGQPCAVLRVGRTAHPDVTLYFERRSDWLIKLERRAREAGVAVNKEYFFSDPAEFQGVRMPTRQIEFMNGRKTLDLTITAYEFPERLDDKVFAKPR